MNKRTAVIGECKHIRAAGQEKNIELGGFRKASWVLRWA